MIKLDNPIFVIGCFFMFILIRVTQEMWGKKLLYNKLKMTLKHFREVSPTGLLLA